MMRWLKSMRLKTVSLAVLLYIIGFSLIEWEGISLIVPFFILLGGAATMLHNDWRDRIHDLGKGKDLAYRNPRTFTLVLIFLWAVVLGLVVVIFVNNVYFGAASLLLTIMGLAYSETRSTPLLPGIWVAVVSGGPLTYALLEKSTADLWLLFVCTTLFVYGREVIKDLDDVSVDAGYKWTLPLYIGESRSKVVSLVFFVTAFVAALFVTPLIFVAAPLLVGMFYVLLNKKKNHTAKLVGDSLLVTTMLIILVFG